MYISPTNEYPKYYGDIVAEHPTWKAEDTLPAGWRKVKEVPVPEMGADEVPRMAAPVEVDGELQQTWEIIELTASQIERRDAPKTAKAKLVALGLSEFEIRALVNGQI
jgi:hypothetical protein